MSDTDLKRVANALDRISLVLAGLYASQFGDVDLGTKAEKLSQCGFTNPEIANLLDTTAGSVKVQRHHARKDKTKRVKQKSTKTK
jgi:hypothetical protein